MLITNKIIIIFVIATQFDSYTFCKYYYLLFFDNHLAIVYHFIHTQKITHVLSNY